jgi:hypothetical protein
MILRIPKNNELSERSIKEEMTIDEPPDAAPG